MLKVLRRKGARATCAVLSVVAFAMAGCGGGEDGGDSASAASNLKGTPVKIGQIVDETSTTALTYHQTPEAARALVKQINANGGIAGHPVELITCDGKSDPNENAACARKMVRDGVAVVTGFSFNVDRILPVLDAAEIAWVGAWSGWPSEFTSKISFPFASARVVGFGMGQAAAENCERPVIVVMDIPATEESAKIVNGALRVNGKPPAPMVKISPAATDYAPQVAEVAQKGDCAVFLASDPNARVFYATMQQLGKDFRIIGLGGTSINDPIIKLAPQATENAISVNLFPVLDGPEFKSYRDAIAQYSDPDKHPFSTISATGTYAALKVISSVAESVLKSGKDVTKATLLTALNNAKQVETDGVLPTLDLSTPLPLDHPRTFNRSVTFHVVQDGKIVPLNGDASFHDLTDKFLQAFGRG